MISAAIENIQITYASIELKFNQTATQTTKAEEMIYPIGTVLFQLFRSYHSRMNKSSLLDNQHGILILFHFHDVTQRLYDQCGDRKYSDHLCFNRTEIQSNCNPDNQSGRNDISDWYSFISAISLIL